ncbi:MAG: hypothetical protein ABS98_15550 [Lysobacteraceae bacterium SCN 69-48]|nr:MAG: hypothetical protein ABS98_15550 [Xanthomonadaceae bacterium SCN 69-48]
MSHPVHPAVVHFPVACWSLATLADGIGLFWSIPWLWQLAFALTVLGCVFGLVAAAAGFLELLKLPAEHPAGSTANAHMGLALTTWCLYAGSVFLRLHDQRPVPPDAWALVLGGVGLLSLLATGWLGGKLVYGYGVGVTAREA